MRVGVAELPTSVGRLLVGRLPAVGQQPDEALAEQDGVLGDHEPHGIRMPPTQTDEGLRAAIAIRDRWPQTIVLVLSQYVEPRYATDLLQGDTRGVGYLLKDRVADVRDFLDAIDRLAAGGTVLDPDIVTEVLARSRRRDRLTGLTAREREVLTLMAEGRTNTAIAADLMVTGGAVEKHITNIFSKLGLHRTGDDHRRVLAVLAWLEG